jgi:hypothetical protein
MAIPFLNHLDVKGNISLNDNKLQDFVVDHSTQAAAGTTAGKLIYDSGSLKFYDGENSQWKTLGTGTGSGTVTSVAITGTDGIQVDSGSPITSNGTIQLGLSAIANDKLANSSVSYGGVSLALGATDATPAFDLTDATNYPTSSLSGTITNAQLAGSIANSKLTNSSITLSQGAGMAAMGAVSLGGSVTVAVDGVLEDLDTLGAPSADGEFIVATGAGAFAYESGTTVRTSLGLGALATLSAVNATTITDNSVGAAELNLSGNGTSGQVLASDGDGTFSWADPDVSITNLGSRLPQISSSVTIGDATDVTLTTSGDLVVTGDLTVSGDTITANVGTLQVEDKNIVMNYHASNDTSSTANGAGITIQDAVNSSTDATILWDATNDEFDFSHPINVTGKVTATGTSVFANLDISGDVDVDGTLETDALTIAGVTSLPFESADHSKLDGIAAGAEVNVATNLGKTTAAGQITITSSTGSNVVIGEATGSIAGLMSTTHHDKLDGIAASATADAAASITETKAGTNASKFVTPDGLAGKSITATIDVSAMDSTVLKAVIDHDLDTHNVIVETSFVTSKEVVVCEYHKDNNGSASTDHLTFHFATVPSEDILVTVTSAKGATSITP